jgi:hypothetical protein
MQLPTIWIRAGCFGGAGGLIAVFEAVRPGAAWDIRDPWSLAAIAAVAAVSAALGRTIYALVVEHKQRRDQPKPPSWPGPSRPSTDAYRKSGATVR